MERDYREMSRRDAGRLSRRQNKLLAWMLDPRTVPVEDPAVDWGAAKWSARELVTLTDLYAGDSYLASKHRCLYDLKVLRTHGKVMGSGSHWWVNPAYRSERMFNVSAPS